MTQISLAGLGLMGAALARCLHAAGRDVTVWNRSPARAAPFAALGVPVAADFAEAVAASPVLLICIDGYPAAHELLGAPGVAALLAGRTVVQLSTGTPKEAGLMADRLHGLGARYLDGAILSAPEQIGTDRAEILLSGDAAAHAACGPLLDCLAKPVRYIGATVGAASALDLAWLMKWFGNILSISHATAICRAEGVPLDDLIALFPSDPYVQFWIGVIRDEAWLPTTMTVRVWAEALARVQQQAVEAGISSEIPDFIMRHFQRAMDAGLGHEDVMAVFKTFPLR